MGDSIIENLLNNAANGEAQNFSEPQSRVEAILQNILGGNNELKDPRSRVEQLLFDIKGSKQCAVTVNAFWPFGNDDLLVSLDNHAEMVYEGTTWRGTFSIPDGWFLDLAGDIYSGGSVGVIMGNYSLQKDVGYTLEGTTITVPNVTDDLSITICPILKVWEPGDIFSGNRSQNSSEVFFTPNDRIDRYSPKHAGFELFPKSQIMSYYLVFGEAANKLRLGMKGYTMTDIITLEIPDGRNSNLKYGNHSGSQYDPGWQKVDRAFSYYDFGDNNTVIFALAPLSDSVAMTDEVKQLAIDNLAVYAVPRMTKKIN